jgi:lysophospholipase L1-like esterase
MFTGANALLDMEVRLDIQPNSSSSFMGVFLRGSTDGQNGYLVVSDSASDLNSTWDIYTRTSGTFNKIKTWAEAGLSGAVSLRARIEGSTISVKVWNQTGTEPSGWSTQTADSSITAPGYPGLYNQGTTPNAGADNFTLDDLRSAGSDFTLTPSSQTASPGSATGNYTVTPNGTPSASTTVALSDGGAGGVFRDGGGAAIAALTFTTAAGQAFTYTPAGGATASPITLTATAGGGFSATHMASCVLNIPATGFSVTPSSHGTTPGAATAAYTVTLNGTLSANETIALSDEGAGGAFKDGGGAITALTFTSANAGAAQTFTYTPPGGSAGATITLTLSGSGAFSAAHSVSCAVSSGPLTVPCTDGHFFFSPGNWDHLAPSTFGVAADTMQASAPGAYVKFAVTGTANLSLNIDTAPLAGYGVPPIVRYSVNGASWTDVGLTNQSAIGLSSSLDPAAVNQVEVYFVSSSTTDGTGIRWGSAGVSPTDVVRITGITVDNGGAISAYGALKPKRALIYSDSIGEGQHVLSGGGNDALQAFPTVLALALNAEYGQVCYGGQGFETIGNVGIPPFMSTYSLYSAGRGRSFSGLDYIFVVHGGNDARQSTPVAGGTIQADVATLLPSLRSLAGPSTDIFICTAPFGGYASDLQAAVGAYRTASGDAKAFHLDAGAYFPAGTFTITFGGTTEWTYDGVHPNIYGSARFGAALGATALAALGPIGSGSGGTTVVTAGCSRAGLANA